uniref:Uncharacterized protein n=1 Tax=Pristionchus pacificus TaxID=54126 RepID=A0A2A6B6H7_PRIPA|eukprot:PDM61453.1 hypothetical protein PRIPAC_50895 [Pristionchus pacificus]
MVHEHRSVAKCEVFNMRRKFSELRKLLTARVSAADETEERGEEGEGSSRDCDDYDQLIAAIITNLIFKTIKKPDFITTIFELTTMSQMLLATVLHLPGHETVAAVSLTTSSAPIVPTRMTTAMWSAG